MTDQFDVYIDDKNSVRCKARGILKSNKVGISVGDYCEVEGNVITKLYQRKNIFIRPNVANVDVILIVVAGSPEPDYLLIDKLIINAINNWLLIEIIV